MKKVITFIVALLPFFVSINVKAVPAYPHPIDVTQPDGSVLTIRLHGDEHFSYITTLDGYFLQQTQQGEYEYARFIDNEFVSTGVAAKNNRTDLELSLLSTLDRTPISEERIGFFRNNSKLNSPEKPQRATRSWKGQNKGLVILVNFTDKSFQYPKSNYENLLNQAGYSYNGATGSVNEYFLASTFHQLDLDFDVFGPYPLQNNMEYYGANQGGAGKDIRASDMILEACQMAFNAGVDFSIYDNDGDGFVDNVFVIFAGNNEAEGAPSYTIWPHRSKVSSTISFNGKLLRDYSCTSELRSTGNTMCGVGTFCHEFGHIIGLPDFYNTENNDSPLGAWSLMSSGGYNNNGNTPPSLCAYERFYLGYLKYPEIDVLNAEGEYMLEPLETSNKAYIISKNDIHNLNGSSPSPREYFIVENHQNIGWNAPLAGILGHGLLIMRINYVSSAYIQNSVNNNPNALGVELMRANNSLTGTTYPGTSNKTTFEPRFLDGSIYADGNLLDIKEEYGNSVFCFRTCGEGRPWVNILPETTEFRTVAGTPSGEVPMRIVGGKLENNVRITFTNTNYYQMKLSEGSWVNSLTFSPNPVDSVIDTLIYVRYNPSQPSYKNVHQDFIEAKTTVGSSPSKRVQLTGKSTREVKVVPPVLETPTKVSPYSFQASWKKVFDATGYYVTVYERNGSSVEVEDFKNFDDIANSGWNQTFYTTTSVSVPSAPVAVLFTNPQDTLYSPYYPEAVTEIKFWVRSEDKQITSSFFIEGLTKDNLWDTVAIVPITLSLTGNTKTYPLEAEKGYRKFKFSVDEISKKGLVFDDFSATYNANNIVSRKFVQSVYKVNDFDSLKILSLSPNKEYICKVQATDKDVLGRYENVTDYSNEEIVKTMNGKDADSRQLSAMVNSDGTVLVSFNDADIIDSKGNQLDLYIFSVTGQLVRHIPYSSFVENPGQVVISGLPMNNTYVISLGAKRKSKFAKVFVK